MTEGGIESARSTRNEKAQFLPISLSNIHKPRGESNAFKNRLLGHLKLKQHIDCGLLYNL